MIQKIFKFLFREFFFLLYHQFAVLYDLVAGIVSLGKWKEWIYSIEPLLEEFPLVELGHGPGHLQRKLLSENKYAIGLDESRQMSRLAKNKLGGLAFRLIRARSQNLPFKNNSIPFFVATFPSEYIFESSTISELHRTMTDSGKLVILLAVWPDGSSVFEKFMKIVFRITGESPRENSDFSQFTNPFFSHGFISSAKIINFQKTKLLTIISQKKITHNLTN